MNKIIVKNIKKKFKTTEALKGISIEFKKNSITGLLGPNGSGKTTLFNIITGFLDADEGSIFLDSEDVSSYSLSKRSNLVNFLQEASMFKDHSISIW